MDQLSTYLPQNLYNEFTGALGASSTASGAGDQYINQFKQAYKNLTGTDPGVQDIQNFIQQAGVSSAGLPGDLSFQDLSSLANNYVQQTYPNQVSQYSQQQQTDQLGKTSGLINNLVSGVTGNAAKLFSDPTSDVYRSFSGAMNNMGITPSSGAFQSGAGSALAGTSMDAINKALETVGIPAIGGIQGQSNMPFQMAQGNSNLGHLNDLQDFGLQSSLASSLAGGGGSNLMGNIFSGLNMGANLANAGANINSSRKSPTWICTHLKKLQLATEAEVDAVHIKLRPSIFRHPIHWLHYLHNAPRLIEICNQALIDWKPVKQVLIDQVLAEPDSEKAWQIYRAECQRLSLQYAPELWKLAECR